jgi:hypothetical protein
METTVMLHVYQRLCKFQEASSNPANFQRIPTKDLHFDSDVKDRLRSRVEQNDFDYTPLQGGTASEGVHESQGSQLPYDAEYDGALDVQPEQKGAAQRVSSVAHAGNNHKRGRPQDAPRHGCQPVLSSASRHGSTGRRAQEPDEVVSKRGRMLDPETAHILDKEMKLQYEASLAGAPVVGAKSVAPVKESKPARKQRLAEERRLQEEKQAEEDRKAQEKPRAAPGTSNWGPIRTDRSGRVISGFPMKTKKNKRKKEREAADGGVAAQASAPAQSAPDNADAGNEEYRPRVWRPKISPFGCH